MNNEMLAELTKITDIIQNAKVTQHLDTAERMTTAFTRKWKLVGEKFSNPICEAMYEEIIYKRNQMIVEDMENAYPAAN